MCVRVYSGKTCDNESPRNLRARVIIIASALIFHLGSKVISHDIDNNNNYNNIIIIIIRNNFILGILHGRVAGGDSAALYKL